MRPRSITTSDIKGRGPTESQWRHLADGNDLAGWMWPVELGTPAQICPRHLSSLKSSPTCAALPVRLERQCAISLVEFSDLAARNHRSRVDRRHPRFSTTRMLRRAHRQRCVAFRVGGLDPQVRSLRCVPNPTASSARAQATLTRSSGSATSCHELRKDRRCLRGRPPLRSPTPDQKRPRCRIPEFGTSCASG